MAEAAPPWLPEAAAFHHIGYACASLARERAGFEALGYGAEGEIFEDPAQGIRGLFLTGPGPRIELLENLAGHATLTPWLERGTRMYHLAWRVADLDAALTAAHRAGARSTRAPLPAVAFGGARIAFVMLRQGLLVELIGNRP